MRTLLIGLLSLAISGAALGQVGITGRIQNKVNDAVNEHNQEVEDAMSDKPNQPQPTVPVAGAIKEGWITRKSKDGKTEVKLYFAYPATLDKTAPAAGLLVLQEWWGVNDDIKERTKDFARHGYYAVAPDLYHGEVTDDPTKAAALKTKMTNESAMTDMKTGLDLLEEEATNGIVDAKRIASIGWCMGGEQSLLLSLADARVKATVLFYGPLVTDSTKLKAIQGPVLAIFGNDDKAPSPADVEKFKAGLKDAGKTDATILQYPNVGHAFASKAAEKVGLYHEAEAKQAWAKTWEWLNQKLAKK